MAELFQWIVALAVIAAFYWWTQNTDSGQEWMAKVKAQVAEKQRAKVAAHTPISQLGLKGAAGLACPKCGGTQFKVRRKTSTKVLFGVASLLGQAKHVRCVTCGAEYVRG